VGRNGHLLDRAAGRASDRARGRLAPGGNDYDIRYELAGGIAKITIDRPERRNAFRPETLIALSDALEPRAVCPSDGST
jgi:1,4-dihydroxy-2-naphthoyl-CoA synthase